MYSKPFQPKWHSFIKTVQRCWNLESGLIRWWNFSTTGHVIPPDLEAECLSPASLLAIPTLQMPPSVPRMSLGMWCWAIASLSEAAEAWGVWRCLCRSRFAWPGPSAIAVSGMPGWSDALQRLVVGSFSHASFHFYSHTPYVGAISNISKLPFNHVLRCLFGALRYLLWLRWHFHYKLLFSVVYNFPPKLPLRVEIFLGFLINRLAVNLFRKLEDNLHSSFGAVKTSGKKSQTNQTKIIFDH